jgi:preprotein translocase subunit SecE
MARQSRAQRRARREAQQASAPALAGGPPAATPRRPTARGGAQPQPRRQPSERHIPGAGAKNFVAESWGELKKVEWPNQKQLIQGVVVVLVACFVVGLYLYGADLVFKRLVENAFLR